MLSEFGVPGVWPIGLLMTGFRYRVSPTRLRLRHILALFTILFSPASHSIYITLSWPSQSPAVVAPFSNPRSPPLFAFLLPPREPHSAPRPSATMGGGPDKEHLLIVLWEPEPKHITAEIKRRFPYIEITYLQLDLSSNPWGGDMTKGVPTGQYLLPHVCGSPRCYSRLDYSQRLRSGGTEADCFAHGPCR
jgi:hypothetical protein